MSTLAVGSVSIDLLELGHLLLVIEHRKDGKSVVLQYDCKQVSLTELPTAELDPVSLHVMKLDTHEWEMTFQLLKADNTPLSIGDKVTDTADDNDEHVRYIIGLDLVEGEVSVIDSWNDITGPVFILDAEDVKLLKEGDIAKLINSFKTKA